GVSCWPRGRNQPRFGSGAGGVYYLEIRPRCANTWPLMNPWPAERVAVHEWETRDLCWPELRTAPTNASCSPLWQGTGNRLSRRRNPDHAHETPSFFLPLLPAFARCRRFT